MKVGDYVEIIEGVYDSAMPSGRRDGFIKEVLVHENKHKNPDQFLIVFSNRAILKFHKSQIRIIDKESEDE